MNDKEARTIICTVLDMNKMWGLTTQAQLIELFDVDVGLADHNKQAQEIERLEKALKEANREGVEGVLRSALLEANNMNAMLSDELVNHLRLLSERQETIDALMASNDEMKKTISRLREILG